MLAEEHLIEPGTITLILGIVSLLFLYWYCTKDFNYWKKRKVPYVKSAIPVLGSSYELFWKPSHEIDLERYRKLGPIYGQFDGNRPVLAVADLKLIREVLVKEFPSFMNRRISYFVTGSGIVEAMLFALQGDEWKRVRGILSPNFSTGRIKRMVTIIKECAETMIENFRAVAESGKPVKSKDVYAAFSMDVIASAAFSVKLDSYNDPKNEFVRNAIQAFSSSFSFKLTIFQLFPRLAKLIRLQVISYSSCFFFKKIILQMMEQRKKTKETRNDFLQLLMATVKGFDEEQKKEDLPNDKDDITSNYGHDESTHQIKSASNKNLTLDAAVAQSVLFFIGGFDTVASTISFVSYLLALNPEIQEKTFEEIREVLQKRGGELTYEAIQEMKYLDNVLSETLRLYPVIPRIERVTEADCKLGNTGIVIPKGMVIFIPVYALHMDPKYFPDPERFDPDRFLPAERAKRDPFTYLPFGGGPRLCLGMRFALMQVKTCLACVIANFKILRAPETKVPLEYHLGPGLMIPKNLVLKYEERIDKIPLK